MPASELRHGVAGTSDSGQSDSDDVRRDTGSAGVAADGCHRGVLAVLPRSPSHGSRPDRLHELIVEELRLVASLNVEVESVARQSSDRDGERRTVCGAADTCRRLNCAGELLGQRFARAVARCTSCAGALRITHVPVRVCGSAVERRRGVRLEEIGRSLVCPPPGVEALKGELFEGRGRGGVDLRGAAAVGVTVVAAVVTVAAVCRVSEHPEVARAASNRAIAAARVGDDMRCPILARSGLRFNRPRSRPMRALKCDVSTCCRPG